MSARELKMFDIQISHKFATIEDAKKVVDALYNFIGYQAKKRKYFCQAIIGVSDLFSDNIITLKQEVTNKKGRPKTEFVFDGLELVENRLTEKVPERLMTQPHIHCLVISSPGEMFAEMISDYLAKKLNPLDVNGNETAVRKMPVNISMISYVFKQCQFLRFPNFRYSDSYDFIPNYINMRRFYGAYRKKAAMNHNDELKPMTPKAQRKIIEEYMKIRNYYYDLLKS